MRKIQQLSSILLSVIFLLNGCVPHLVKIENTPVLTEHEEINNPTEVLPSLPPSTQTSVPQEATEITAGPTIQPTLPEYRDDQRGVAKVVFALPIMPVGLKGVASIRAKEHDPSARFQHTHHLLDRHGVILHVLQNLVAEDDIHACRLVRQVFSGGAEHVRREGTAFHHPRIFDIDTSRKA